MTETGERLFSYGTLRFEAVQLECFGRVLAGQPDRLRGYRQTLRPINEPAVVALSGLAAHPIVRATGDPADHVEGTVFAITPAELAAADAYEVGAYRRIAVQLGSGLTAWAYVG